MTFYFVGTYYCENQIGKLYGTERVLVLNHIKRLSGIFKWVGIRETGAYMHNSLVARHGDGG